MVFHTGTCAFYLKRGVRDSIYYLRGRFTERQVETERSSICQFIPHSEWPQQPELGQFKPKSVEILAALHESAGTQEPGPFAVAFLSTLTGTWIGSGESGT